ncbi:hypothetical protein [Bacillus anthracis]|nr:hypothetical protein [Bacillus anthracis]AIK30046.1 hypothetical protein DJ48_3741 [Bacillus anthracis]AJH86820.1 hypothetical protein BF27_1487 [Bacillus anthracis]UKX84457.1 hypothetical protein KM387_02500 [Bacillus anthracis]
MSEENKFGCRNWVSPEANLAYEEKVPSKDVLEVKREVLKMKQSPPIKKIKQRA